MGDRGTPVGLLLPIVAAGCNASLQLALELRLQEKCHDVGLRGCEEISEGVLLYVQGEKETGTPKIKAGAAKNAPSQVRHLAVRTACFAPCQGPAKTWDPLLEGPISWLPLNGAARLGRPSRPSRLRTKKNATRRESGSPRR